MGYTAPTPERAAHALDLYLHEHSPLPATCVAVRYPAGHSVPEHQHACGHVLYAAEGVLRVQTPAAHWLLPPTAAVWLRPGVPHRLHTPVAVRAYGVFIHPAHGPALPAHDGVLHASALLRELIAALALVDPAQPPTPRAQLLGQLLVTELSAGADSDTATSGQPLHRPLHRPFHLPWPADATLARICTQLLAQPDDAREAAAWAAQSAMSAKTLQRRFLRHTGLGFGQWRQQMRLLHSLPLLLADAPITQAALQSGYGSPGAYSAAFRKHFGCTPSEFLAGKR
ncbi:AraC family transcriptional regulator [Vandammella animalimorsus]|uniref:AraC family transcriptional regulator n=1 Tax=Vandammella animalimorsus TaxID=2029117 RepID=A0A2A2T7A9_9BURK|nr:helix-turn-helix transcriptional regulator [Vandammella animalimorsus]PAT32727.1 AraC family transcriptional regulator [Vandammella animalimorsus]PAX17758.1 AraC family transcriptional regulator [Vandammella animalimorsus]PAX19912.1 AraC family transcriptional regulator [Vandammella animalimorsus]